MPSTATTCERNFSRLSFIKNKLRNKLGEDVIENLILGFLRKDFVNKVLDDKILRDKALDIFKDLGCDSGDNKNSRK